MIELKISCSTCGKEYPEQIPVLALDLVRSDSLQTFIWDKRWILQVNGSNWDTYCSPECAK